MTLHFLFDQTYLFLGEMTSEEGRLYRFLLSQDGERMLGFELSLWQTQGIPIRREVRSFLSDRTQKIDFFQVRVQPKQKEFLSALEQWMSDRGFWMVAILSDAMLPLWQKLLHTSLGAQERFAILVAITKTLNHTSSDWEKTIDEILAVHA